jgi:phosphatidate cytidylyltransferase
LFKTGLLLTGWSFSFFSYSQIIDKIIFNEIFKQAGVLIGGGGLLMIIIGGLISIKAGIKSFFRAASGLVYISLSFALLMHIRSGDLWFGNDTNHFSSLFLLEAKWVPIILIGAIWVNDTMAYMVGSFIGKTPLSPISPKKTWEGTVGGILLSVLVGFLIGYYFFNPIASKHIATIALIASVTGTYGDLLESKLKRLAGVKDSGTLMPGHGGFLDRFDSLLIATPFVWMYLCWISL